MELVLGLEFLNLINLRYQINRHLINLLLLQCGNSLLTAFSIPIIKVKYAYLKISESTSKYRKENVSHL